MANKRHQARNEKALQDLIKTVPGNDRCADCQARNPGWASWSLGVFLCMRCAALHRKLGTHISKVKSLSMDSWSTDQVDKMKRNGNETVNRIYNPKNSKPPIPLDVDEVDTAMERFIRQKYDLQTLSSNAPRTNSNRAGNSDSADDEPPPPPPKHGRRFGFNLRAASAALPQYSEDSPPLSPGFTRRVSEAQYPMKVNKPSRVFGATIGITDEGMAYKLTTLKEMGFPDDKRNSNVLKGLNGDLERAIESLVRLGEGPAPASRNMTPVRTPTSAKFPETVQQAPNSIEDSSRLPPATSHTINGQHLQPTLPIHAHLHHQQSKPVPPLPGTTQYSYNPFDTSNPMSAPLQPPPPETAFQNMHITQPLFPNATGGYPNPRQQFQEMRMQQSVTPPIPQLPQQIFHPNPYAQQPHKSYNPFMNSGLPDVSAPTSTSYSSSNQIMSSTNPFQNQNMNSFQFPVEQTHIIHSLGVPQPQQTHQIWIPQLQASQQFQTPYNMGTQQQQQQLQTMPQQQLLPQQPQLFQSPTQPFWDPHAYASYTQPPFPQSNFPSQPMQQQSLVPQPTGKIDKSSILALYNYRQLAPSPLTQETSESLATESSSPPKPPAPRHPSQVQRSVTMPMPFAGSKNPFIHSGTPLNSTAGSSALHRQGSHVSQASIDTSNVQNGRHSPDAFASLSARFLR